MASCEALPAAEHAERALAPKPAAALEAGGAE
jgi:hypothetical protein